MVVKRGPRDWPRPATATPWTAPSSSSIIGNCANNPTTWDIGASVEECDDWWWGKKADEVINTIFEEQD
ncbi:MAG: hypothetical protein KAY32_02315 [Candidatus Eisenbacteria sp.]|nr:hypothetical protein [Candidatus Eisenbacteria bacterium]